MFEVSNTLGVGFLEKVYERALLKELNIRGIQTRAQASFPVTYKGHPVGEYFADIIEEVREPAIPESYWEPLRTKVTRMEQQWLQAHARGS